MSNEKDFYTDLLRFCGSLITEFYKKFTIERLSNTLAVSDNPITGQDESPATISLPDNKMIVCISRGLKNIRLFLKQLQDDEDGIAAVGINIEAWRMENIAVNIITHKVKLHGIPNFFIDDVSCNMADGLLQATLRWPEAYLSENGLFNGIIDGKAVSGYGDFKIIVTNLVIGIQLKFIDKSQTFEIGDFRLTPDFENVKIAVTGLKVEGGGKAEEIINQAIQREKVKVKLNLLKTATTISAQVKEVLNEKIHSMSKYVIVRMVMAWCRL